MLNLIATFALVYLVQAVGAGDPSLPSTQLLTILLIGINCGIWMMAITAAGRLILLRDHDAFIVYASQIMKILLPISISETIIASGSVLVIAGTLCYYGWLYSAAAWCLFGAMTTTFHSRTRKHLTAEHVREYLHKVYQTEMNHKRERNEPTVSFETWLEKNKE